MTPLTSKQTINNLSRAENAESIFDIALSYFLAHGISHVLYCYSRGYLNTPVDTILLTNMPDWWTEKYRNEGYAAIDPFFTYCCQSYKTMRTGIEYMTDYNYLNEPERNLIREAAETGFRAGTSYIVRRRGVGPDFGGWNLGTSLNKQEFEALYAREGEQLRAVAMHTHEQLTLKLFKDEDETNAYRKEVLTPRQLDCLTLLAQGKRTKQIADLLHIKSITVDHHLKLARDKLKASTREQAVARAVIRGLIDISAYSEP